MMAKISPGFTSRLDVAQHRRAAVFLVQVADRDTEVLPTNGEEV